MLIYGTLRTFVTIVAAALASFEAAGRAIVINWNFNGGSALGSILRGSGYTPVLTAAQSIAPSRSGWLRLTSNGGNQAACAYNSWASKDTNANHPDYASYDGADADRLTLFLADARSTFAVGACGGAQNIPAGGDGAKIKRMNSSYIGIGIDEYGNCTDLTEDRIRNIGHRPNTASVSGPGHNLTGYDCRGDNGPRLTAPAFPGLTTRPMGTGTRTIGVAITATNQLPQLNRPKSFCSSSLLIDKPAIHHFQPPETQPHNGSHGDKNHEAIPDVPS